MILFRNLISLALCLFFSWNAHAQIHPKNPSFDYIWRFWDANQEPDKTDISDIYPVSMLEQNIQAVHTRAISQKNQDVAIRSALVLAFIYHDQAKFDAGLPLLSYLNDHIPAIPKKYLKGFLVRYEEELRGKNNIAEAIVIRKERIRLGYIQTFWEIYRDCGLYDYALKDYVAFQPYPTFTDMRRLVYYERLALLYMNTRNFKQAKKTFQQGIIQADSMLVWNIKFKRFDPIFIQYWKGNFTGMSASCDMEMGDYTNILPRLSTDMQFSVRNIDHKIGIHFLMGDYYMHEKQYTEAKKQFDLGRGLLAGKISRPLRLIHLSRFLNYFKTIGKSDSAYHYLQAYTNYRDSISTALHQNQAILLLGKLELNSRREVLFNTKTQLKTEKKKTESQQIQLNVLIFFLITFIIIGFIVFVNFRQTKMIEKNVEVIEWQHNRNEILLKELHHRVKNNLQVVSSLLNLQKRRIPNPESIDIISALQNRIQTIALIHHSLHDSNEYDFVNVEDYVRTLIDHLATIFFNEHDSVVDIVYTLDHRIKLPLDRIASFGLILNEIVSNAFKYAYVARQGKLFVRIQLDAQIVTVHVGDDGPGDEEVIRESKNLGMKLVDIMCQQIGAVHRMYTDQGFWHEFKFSL